MAPLDATLRPSKSPDQIAQWTSYRSSTIFPAQRFLDIKSTLQNIIIERKVLSMRPRISLPATATD